MPLKNIAVKIADIKAGNSWICTGAISMPVLLCENATFLKSR
jgi:hypothetical protein